jgi:hypothetical protein
MAEARPARPRFAMIPLDVVGQLYDLGLITAAAGVYAVIAAHANKLRRAWPANETIAAIVHCTTRTVARAKRTLEAAGLIIARPRHTMRGGTLSTLYELADEALDEAPAVSGGDDIAVSGNQTKESSISPKEGKSRDARASARENPPQPTPAFSQNSQGKKGEADPPRQPPPRPRKPHHCAKPPLPDGWTPKAADRSYAYEKGLDDDWIDENARQFCDHHIARDNRFADERAISAGWRRWIDREPEFAQRRGRETPAERDQRTRAAIYRAFGFERRDAA